MNTEADGKYDPKRAFLDIYLIGGENPLNFSKTSQPNKE